MSLFKIDFTENLSHRKMAIGEKTVNTNIGRGGVRGGAQGARAPHKFPE